MKQRGLVEKPDKKKSAYQITQKGRDYLANPPQEPQGKVAKSGGKSGGESAAKSGGKSGGVNGGGKVDEKVDEKELEEEKVATLHQSHRQRLPIGKPRPFAACSKTAPARELSSEVRFSIPIEGTSPGHRADTAMGNGELIGMDAYNAGQLAKDLRLSKLNEGITRPKTSIGLPKGGGSIWRIHLRKLRLGKASLRRLSRCLSRCQSRRQARFKHQGQGEFDAGIQAPAREL